MTTKRIAAITMARNDEFFLNRWIKYYGEQIGDENLYIYLDGLDQKTPSGSGRAHITKLPHKDEARQRGDKTRILLLSDLAKKLFDDGYDIVIGCDCDEFLVVDPDLNMTLAEYLASKKVKTTLSGLGLDVGQDLNSETALDMDKPFLSQRKYALMSTRYTKPVVLFRPATWGSGFHSVKGHNFHIDKNLYLLHFGSVDMDMIKNKLGDRTASWEKHLQKRARTITIITRARNKNMSRPLARIMQTILRPIYDWNKPAMLGLKWVTTIPKRFQETGI
ncbi:MAG: glycosyltransferase family 2 protein [Alphaproteobacteria bacterium]|nr:glycosyltransferase family 2 protein [Alphaproteobacteria bacterium]